MLKWILAIIFVMATIGIGARARAETYMEPVIYEGGVGPLSVSVYEARSIISWHRSDTYYSLVVPVSPYVLGAALIAACATLGILLFLWRRRARQSGGDGVME